MKIILKRTARKLEKVILLYEHYFVFIHSTLLFDAETVYLSRREETIA